MREIVTLQLGERSNYLATHFWNAQESYFTYSAQETSTVDHDVHFRAGVGADGSDTFTPRTIIYDLKGGFGTLRKFNALYESLDDAAPVRGLWDGETSTHRERAIEPTPYQTNLDLGLPTSQLHASDVRYWSDFNRVFYHPRSIVQINDFELHSQLMPFEAWATGEELFQNLDTEFDLLDRDIRPFAEECDQMQGFQILTGSDDAWGGFASRYLEKLHDEYGKSSIWVWGIEDASKVARPKQTTRWCNVAKSLWSIVPQASTYVRLAAPPSPVPDYVHLRHPSEWATAALLCAGIETITLPTRLRSDAVKRGSMATIEGTLNTDGNQNIYELCASIRCAPGHDAIPLGGKSSEQAKGSHLPRPSQLHASRPESSPLDFNYTPTHPEGSQTTFTKRIFAQVECERDHQGQSSQEVALTPEREAYRRLNEDAVVDIYQTQLPFPLLDTFPDTLFETTPRAGSGLDMVAALVSTSTMQDHVLDLRNASQRHVSREERENMYNDLTQIAQSYSAGWDSGSDSGDDYT